MMYFDHQGTFIRSSGPGQPVSADEFAQRVVESTSGIGAPVDDHETEGEEDLELCDRCGEHPRDGASQFCRDCRQHLRNLREERERNAPPDPSPHPRPVSPPTRG